MKAMIIRTLDGFVGSTADDHEAWLKFQRQIVSMPVGKWLRLEWASPRNGKHHRKLYALLCLIEQNSEVYDTKEKALVAIKLAAGFFDPHVDPETGDVQKVPHSIAYESMSQEQFSVFYERAVSAVCDFIVPQFDEETAYRLLDHIVEGWAR